MDIHTANASRMFDKKPADITKDLRQAAKHLSFGVIYQMSAASLALELDTSVERAKELITQFFTTFRHARDWIEDTKRTVLSTGKLITPFRRMRRFGFISKQNRAEILRQAVNFPIQSGASDVTLQALIRVGKQLWNDPDTRLLLTVHDSILVETRTDVREAATLIKDEMERPVLDGSVPFVADIKAGPKWGSCKEITV